MPPIPSRPVVYVTGASKGIGLAVTRILLETFHAKVLTISRTISPELEALKKQYKDEIVTVQGDVAEAETSLKAFKLEPNPTGLVLNAGIADLKRIEFSDTAHWQKTFDINVFSLIQTLVPTLPALRKNNGKVVFVSSGAATGGTAGWAAYNASKAAMNAICRTLANEEPNIATFAVRPGVVDTDMQVRLRSGGGEHMKSDDHQRFLQLHESGNLVKPEDSGYVLAALAVNGSKDLSGQFLTWNGPECAPYQRK